MSRNTSEQNPPEYHVGQYDTSRDNKSQSKLCHCSLKRQMINNYDGISPPYFHRKTNKVNSHLKWGCNYETLVERQMQDNHMMKAFDELNELFEQNRNSLPRKSVLTGVNHGGWSFCPNAIADEAEKIILKAQSDFLEMQYCAGAYDECVKYINGKCEMEVV